MLNEIAEAQKETAKINNEIIQTMLHQLGGHKFFVMTGSKPQYKKIQCIDPLIALKLKRNISKANYLLISYIVSADLYTMEFIRMTENKRDVIAEFTSVYGDQLQDIFTSKTGLIINL